MAISYFFLDLDINIVLLTVKYEYRSHLQMSLIFPVHLRTFIFIKIGGKTETETDVRVSSKLLTISSKDFLNWILPCLSVHSPNSLH
jgi:hypothetical protein